MSCLFHHWRAGMVSKYSVDHSTRFRASASARIFRTFGAALSRKIWTLSLWLKRGELGRRMGFFATNGAVDYFEFQADNTMMLTLNNNTSGRLTTSKLFRDPSAHMHVVIAMDTTQAVAADRWKLYVNGVQITAFSTANYPALNYDTAINSAVVHYLGADYNLTASQFFDGYLSEINFIDGQALAPSLFGETDGSGVWIPKKYSGTYGANGSYLSFKNGNNLPALTADGSGNGNNWSSSGISITSGATYDWMLDSLMNNYATLNPLTLGSSALTNGNLTSAGATVSPTILPTSGTWYLERGGVALTWTPPAAFPAAAGDYNFGQRPFANTPTAMTLCTANLPAGGSITMSGSFTGNANANGPFVWLGGTPEQMTINSNSVTWGTHADKTAGGFKIRTSSASYNAAGNNTYTVTVAGNLFGGEGISPNNGQVNP
jgi:hypothetical protein